MRALTSDEAMLLNNMLKPVVGWGSLYLRKLSMQSTSVDEFVDKILSPCSHILDGPRLDEAYKRQHTKDVLNIMDIFIEKLKQSGRSWP